MSIDELTHKNANLFMELEFWKSTALELGATEDAYEECCRDVERMSWEMDPYNTGEIHG